MARECVYDATGREIGSYEHDSALDRINARDAAGKLLGYFDHRSGSTYSSVGEFLANRNVLVTFIMPPLRTR